MMLILLPGLNEPDAELGITLARRLGFGSVPCNLFNLANVDRFDTALWLFFLGVGDGLLTYLLFCGQMFRVL